ncbi:MAG: hypothetical protein AB7U05_14290 [Mangrovibacterium sp.]
MENSCKKSRWYWLAVILVLQKSAHSRAVAAPDLPKKGSRFNEQMFVILFLVQGGFGRENH